MLSKQLNKIAVLGGGISGLSQAYNLQKQFPDSQITIYDKQPRLGGALESVNVSGNIYDNGPRSLRSQKNCWALLQICDELNLLEKIIPSESHDQVFLYYDDKMRSVPRSGSPKVFMNFLQDNPKLITSAFKDIRFNSAQKKDDKTIEETIHDIARIGPIQLNGLASFLTDYFANAVFQGIYRATPDKLSANMCLKKVYIKQYFEKYYPEADRPEITGSLKEYLDKFKASSFSFDQGLQTLPDTMSKFLESKDNMEIKLDSDIQNIVFDSKNPQIKVETDTQSQDYDLVVSTINANILSQKLQQQSQQEISQQLAAIEHLSMKTLNLGYDSKVVQDKYKSFGALIPSVQKYDGLGLILGSTIFPDYVQNQDRTTLSLFLSDFVKQEDIKDKESMQKLAQKCLKEMIQIEEEPSYFDYKEWKNFFPVYGPGHMNKINKLIKQTKEVNPNFYLHGNYMFTGAIPDLVLLSNVITNIIKKKYQ